MKWRTFNFCLTYKCKFYCIFRAAVAVLISNNNNNIRVSRAIIYFVIPSHHDTVNTTNTNTVCNNKQHQILISFEGNQIVIIPILTHEVLDKYWNLAGWYLLFTAGRGGNLTRTSLRAGAVLRAAIWPAPPPGASGGSSEAGFTVGLLWYCLALGRALIVLYKYI